MVESVRPMVVILMGVSGCGKSVVGEALAGRLGWEFVEGDGFHSEANVAKMRGGVGLTDEDRRGWLERLAGEIRSRVVDVRRAVVACSALKRGYRDMLAVDSEHVRFVFMDGSRELIAERLKGRSGHYMPAELLDSQFGDLERPVEGEGVLVVGIDKEVGGIVDEIVLGLINNR